MAKQNSAIDIRFTFTTEYMNLYRWKNNSVSQDDLTTGQYQNSLEDTLFVHREVESFETSGDCEDVDEEGAVVETTHFVDMKSVAAHVGEYQMVRIESFVGGDQPRLEARA